MGHDRGELTPAVATMGASDAQISANEIAAKFASVHATFHNHFNSERHLVSRDIYKERRSAALAEWQNLAA